MENDISSVFADENGGIWVGTLFQGLCYYHPCMRKFMLGHTVTGSALITNESIRCFFEDTDGSLFIGGGKGVFRFEPLTGKIYKVFELEENDVCLTVMKDSSGALWIGTFLHGFYRIKDGREYNYLRSSKNLQSDPNQNVSRAIYEDSEGHFLVSVTGGVGLFDPVVGKIQYMLSDKHPDLKSYMVVHALYPWDKHSNVQKRIGISVVRDSVSGDFILKMVNMLPVKVEADVNNLMSGNIQRKAEKIVLSGQPVETFKKPVQTQIEQKNKLFYELPPYSFTIIRIKD